MVMLSVVVVVVGCSCCCVVLKKSLRKFFAGKKYFVKDHDSQAETPPIITGQASDAGYVKQSSVKPVDLEETQQVVTIF